MSVHLVLIEPNNIYTFYSGRIRIAKVQSKLPMPLDWIEIYRANHALLLEHTKSTPTDPTLA